MGQDRLAGIVRCCCSKPVLSQVLQINAERAELLAVRLASAILPLFRKSNRQQRVNLKKIMSQREHPESLHEVADLLREMVAQALHEAVSDAGVADIAKEVFSTSSKRDLPRGTLNFNPPLPASPVHQHAHRERRHSNKRHKRGVTGKLLSKAWPYDRHSP